MKFSVIVFVITLCFGAYMAMASEPDVVNLTKEQQENLAEYISSVLKSIQTKKVEFNKYIKEDYYKAIFTDFHYVKNMTQKEITDLKECKNYLRLKAKMHPINRMYGEENVEEYIYILAVLAAGTSKFQEYTKSDKKFEYYTSLRILNRRTNSLDMFSEYERKDYNSKLAEAVESVDNIDVLLQAAQTKSHTGYNPSSHLSSNTSPQDMVMACLNDNMKNFIQSMKGIVEERLKNLGCLKTDALSKISSIMNELMEKAFSGLLTHKA